MHCDMFWSLALKIAVGKQNCVGLGDSHRLFARTADTVFSRNHLWVKDTHGDHRPGKQGWWADAKPQIAACFFGGITQSCQTCSYPQPLATRHLFYRSENPMVKGCVHNRMLQLQRAGDPQNALRFAKCPHLHWCAR